MKKYYDKDPEKGGKEISGFELISKILPDKFNPIHDYELLIPFRENIYMKEKTNFINNRNLYKLITDDGDISGFRIMWLKKELKVIKEWQAGKSIPPNDLIFKIDNVSILELAKYFTYIESGIYEIEKNLKPAKEKKRTSYVWQNKPDKELPELYSLMMDKYKLIALETTYEQFKAVFTGQPIESINPIKWHQDNASELLYFIDRLEQSNNIEHNPKRADYQKLKACFVKPDGKQFIVALKSLKSNIDINLSPDKQKAIDELVNNF